MPFPVCNSRSSSLSVVTTMILITALLILCGPVAAAADGGLPPPQQQVAACNGVFVSLAAGENLCIKSGSSQMFKDCPDCPEMVVVPAGSFVMGSPESEPERYETEGPQHKVTIAKPFAAGRFAVTFAEWDACTADGGCGGYRPDDGWRGQHWGRGDRPVINVSWKDAKAYLTWLSSKTGKQYRLLSEAEREYVARAGTTTPFWWGSTLTAVQANFAGNFPYNGAPAGELRGKTLPVNSFEPNAWGLYQVHGNVSEWQEDCLTGRYVGAPADGSAMLVGDCAMHALRGGSWGHDGRGLRAAYRHWEMFLSRISTIGFRCARVLE